MKRVIYSIYIDIPEKEHYARSFNYEKQHNLDRSKLTRENFSKHRDRLINNKKEYCKNIDVPFMMFEYDLRYQDYGGKEYENRHSRFWM